MLRPDAFLDDEVYFKLYMYVQSGRVHALLESYSQALCQTEPQRKMDTLL
jgi:hypothetical protein